VLNIFEVKLGEHGGIAEGFLAEMRLMGTTQEKEGWE